MIENKQLITEYGKYDYLLKASFPVVGENIFKEKLENDHTG